MIIIDKLFEFIRNSDCVANSYEIKNIIIVPIALFYFLKDFIKQ